jgi:hypothetical protein
MGIYLSRWWVARKEGGARAPEAVRVMVVGDKGAGKTYFLDSFDPAMEPAMTRRPTNGFHDVTFEHMRRAVSMKELGGGTQMLLNLAERMALDHDVIYYFVDVTQPLYAVYAAKQRFLKMLLSLPSDAPLCLVFNVPPPPVQYGVLPPARPYRALSSAEARRVFQVKSLRGRCGVSTLYLTYDDATPVEQLLDWTVTHPPRPPAEPEEHG